MGRVVAGRVFRLSDVVGGAVMGHLGVVFRVSWICGLVISAACIGVGDLEFGAGVK